jgi:putative transposase
VLSDRRPQATRPAPLNKLSKIEVQTILNVANAPEYASLPPSQIVPKLADKGLYHGSESSFYHVPLAYDQVHYRGRSRVVQKRSALVRYVTTGPNQVWSWDYSLPPVKGLRALSLPVFD